MNKKTRWVWMFWAVFLLGAAIRFVVAAEWVHTFDLKLYNIPWSIGMGEHGFQVYTALDNLDYPPVFPLLLWTISGQISPMGYLQAPHALMFWIKLWPVLFDLALTVLIWKLGLRQSERFACLVGAFWALNPSAIFNCAVWGQTDEMLLLMILLSVVAFWDKRPVWGTVWFAVGCLTKLQMAYFLPVLLLELFLRYKPRKAIQSLAIGGAVGVLGWLPFMIASRSVEVPFRIYFGGFDKYNYLDLNAFNVYGIFSANWVPDDTPLVGSMTFRHVNMLITVLLTAGLLYRSLCKKAPLAYWEHAFFWMNGIFILTTKMHERYQLPVMMLAMAGFLLTQKRQWATMTLAMTAMTFLNQWLLFEQQVVDGGWNTAFLVGQVIGSVLNVAIFVVFAWGYLRGNRGNVLKQS